MTNEVGLHSTLGRKNRRAVEVGRRQSCWERMLMASTFWPQPLLRDVWGAGVWEWELTSALLATSARWPGLLLLFLSGLCWQAPSAFSGTQHTSMPSQGKYPGVMGSPLLSDCGGDYKAGPTGNCPLLRVCLLQALSLYTHKKTTKKVTLFFGCTTIWYCEFMAHGQGCLMQPQHGWQR